MTKLTKSQATSKNANKIVKEVREHIRNFRMYFQSNIDSFLGMTAFINSEVYNNSMWDKADYLAYQNLNRVCLSFNKIRPIIKQIIGEDEKLSVDMKLRKVGEDNQSQATLPMQQQNMAQMQTQSQQQMPNPMLMRPQHQDACEILEGLVRNIAYNSNSQTIYKDAYVQCLEGGFAAWRVIVNVDKGVNSLAIRKVRNPVNCYWDPNAQSNTKTDGQYCGLTSKMGKAEFERIYKLPYPDQFTDGTAYHFEWGNKTNETLTIGEEYRKEYYKKTQYLLSNNKWINEEEYKELSVNNPELQIIDKRTYDAYKIMHYKFTDRYILEKSETPFDELPLVFVAGDRKMIGNIERLYSFAVDAKDSQRRLNFIGSEQIEWLKAHKRAKFMIPDKTTDDYKDEWKDLTTTSYLHYKPQILLGTILKPEVINPPSMPADLVHQYAQAENDIKQALGRYEPNLGQRGQTQESGIYALNLATQGNSVLGAFRRGRNEAIQMTGKIILNAIPKVYDSARMITITGQNGEDKELMINQANLNEDGSGYAPQKIFQKNKYSIEVGVSSSFPMQKMANAKVILDLIAADKTGKAYDLLAQMAAENIDVNKAQQIADRLKTLVPPKIIAEEENAPIPPQMQQQQMMQQQIMQLEMSSKMLDNKLKQADIQLKAVQAMLQQQQAGLTNKMGQSTILNSQAKLMDSQTNRMKAETQGQLEAAKLEAENMRSMADEERSRVELTHKILKEEKSKSERI